MNLKSPPPTTPLLLSMLPFFSQTLVVIKTKYMKLLRTHHLLAIQRRMPVLPKFQQNLASMQPKSCDRYQCHHAYGRRNSFNTDDKKLRNLDNFFIIYLLMNLLKFWQKAKENTLINSNSSHISEKLWLIYLTGKKWFTVVIVLKPFTLLFRKNSRWTANEIQLV